VLVDPAPFLFAAPIRELEDFATFPSRERRASVAAQEGMRQNDRWLRAKILGLRQDEYACCEGNRRGEFSRKVCSAGRAATSSKGTFPTRRAKRANSQ
jgi:hypothetical protein